MNFFFRKLLWLLRRRRREMELQDELQFHLDEEAEERETLGVDKEEAHWAARRELGNITLVKENTRAVWAWTFIEQIVQDCRYALRGFKSNPGFAMTTILSLSLGLGASLSIYTIADNLLLRPLPYSHPSQLVMLWEQNASQNFLHGIVAPRNYFDWKSRNDVFEQMSVFDTAHVVVGDSERSEEVTEIEASPSLLPMLGMQPVLGRRFGQDDNRPGSAPVVLISYRLWQSWFGGDHNIIGKQLQCGGSLRTIVGVLPSYFYFYNRNIDAWIPLNITPAANAGDGRWLWCVARLKPGVNLKQAQSEMSAIAHQRTIDDPYFNKGWTIAVEPLRDALVRNVKPSLLVLLCAVGLLLVVACANVASLLLARYTTRQREIALRTSLGAGRVRMIRQLLTESTLLAIIGGTLGMLLAKWAVIILVALAPKNLTQSIEIVTDIRIYVVAACVAGLTSILFGLAPALAGSRSTLMQTMQTDSRSSIGAKTRLRSWFVGAEVALSVVLLSGALLLIRSLQALENVNSGIDANHLLTLRVSLPGTRYNSPSKTIPFFTRASQQINSLPGVRSASAVSHLPLNGMAPSTLVLIAGQPRRKPGEDIGATIRTVLPGYFRTMGIPLLKGRDFTAADDTQESPHRFIVSRAFVRKYLGDSNPIDQKLSVWMERDNPYGQIIGVVGDVKDETLDQPTTPTVYYPHAHLAYNHMIFVVRTEGNPLSLVELIRRVIRRIDPAQPVADVKTMNEVVADTFSRQHFSAFLLAGFSCASLLVAAIGIYGILIYTVSEKTREIGVRVALGATPGKIASMIIRTAARPVIGGLIAGIGGALALTGLLRSLLFATSPQDPVTFIVVPAVLAGVALVAAYLPARRAAHLEPAEALRAD
jgi:putative ABC transport system permease protein